MAHELGGLETSVLTFLFSISSLKQQLLLSWMYFAGLTNCYSEFLTSSSWLSATHKNQMPVKLLSSGILCSSPHPKGHTDTV